VAGSIGMMCSNNSAFPVEKQALKNAKRRKRLTQHLSKIFSGDASGM